MKACIKPGEFREHVQPFHGHSGRQQFRALLVLLDMEKMLAAIARAHGTVQARRKHRYLWQMTGAGASRFRGLRREERRMSEIRLATIMTSTTICSTLIRLAAWRQRTS